MAASRRPNSSKQPALPDRKAELLQAYQDVVKFANEKPVPLPPEPPSRAPFWISMATLVVILTTLTIWQPPWLFTQAPSESPALVEASLRARVYAEILRVDRFRNNNGRLPDTLLEALGDTTGVEYEVKQGNYSLTGHSGGLTIVYRSDMAAKQFLGNAYALIRARPKS